VISAVALAASVGAGIALFLAKARSNYLRLPELIEAPGGAAPDLTVVIPARNEEVKIERAVRSFPGLPVRVVDDESQDRTAERAAAAGARVIPAPPLAGRRKGKPNACLAGARGVSSQWLLFVDADTWYHPAFAPSLAAYAEREGLDMVSVFPRQITVTLAERALLPYAFALYFTGVNAVAVNSPESSEALANGQCLLFRRSAYDAIGGHDAVADSIIEDVDLARVAKRHGLRTRVLRAGSLASVRMYDSFGAIWHGFQKNSFRFLLVNPLTGVQVVVASILLASWLPVLAALIAAGEPVLAVLFALAPTVSLLPWYRSFRDALLAPAAIYLFQAIAVWGMVATITGHGAVWKGRRVN
jgi:chlorobactene glucosyltransferase